VNSPNRPRFAGNGRTSDAHGGRRLKIRRGKIGASRRRGRSNVGEHRVMTGSVRPIIG
jgi:hypothetical protein